MSLLYYFKMSLLYHNGMMYVYNGMMYVYVGQIGKIVYAKYYKSVAFFFAAYYNNQRYIEKARGAFGLRKVTDYT